MPLGSAPALGLVLGDLERLFRQRVSLIADRPEFVGDRPHRVGIVVGGHPYAHQRGFADEPRNARALASGGFWICFMPSRVWLIVVGVMAWRRVSEKIVKVSR